MQKVQYNDFEICNTIYQSPYSHVFTVKADGFHVGKTVSGRIRGLYRVAGTSYEEKILSGDTVVGIPEIYKPTSAIYLEGECIGYFQMRNYGKPLIEYEMGLDNSQREDLYRYADIYTKLERIVKKGHEQNIIFPDLLTFDNLYIDNDGNLSLIDFDGLQIGDKSCITISSYLGTEYDNSSAKFYNSKKGLWTRELDKKSLLYFYFLYALGLDLSSVGTINPVTGKRIKLIELLNTFGLVDEKIIAKIEKILSDSRYGEFFGQAVYEIANKYNLLSVPSVVDDDVYYKVLVPKR